MVALALLPATAASAHFLHHTISTCAALREQIPWMTVFCLGLGFSTMVSVYLALPRWNWIYVFGHEATHAVAVLLSGGRVTAFKVNSSGGHVVTDTISAWIALAPYIVPFYPVAAGLAWFAARFFWPQLSNWEWAFLIFWGGTWAFHFCFTASLLKTEQPDFACQGYVFSFVVILTSNLLILSGLLLIWLRPEKWQEELGVLWNLAAHYYQYSAIQLHKLYRLAF